MRIGENVKVSGEILAVSTKTGNAITPTPKYAATIRGNFDIDLSNYDDTRFMENAWICEGGGAKEDILDTVCSIFREKLSEKLDEFAKEVNTIHPTYGFGNLYIDRLEPTKPRLELYVCGHSVGYICPSGVQLEINITDPTLKKGPGDVYNFGFMDDPYRSSTYDAYAKTTTVEYELGGACKKWIQDRAIILATNIVNETLNIPDVRIDYESVVRESPEFLYLVTRMTYNETKESPKHEIVEKVLSQYQVYISDGRSECASQENTGTISIPVYNTPYYEKYLISDDMEYKYSLDVSNKSNSSPDVLKINRTHGDSDQTIATIVFERTTTDRERPERCAVLNIIHSQQVIPIYTFDISSVLSLSPASGYSLNDPTVCRNAIFEKLCAELAYHLNMNKSALQLQMHKTAIEQFERICHNIYEGFKKYYCDNKLS